MIRLMLSRTTLLSSRHLPKISRYQGPCLSRQDRQFVPLAAGRCALSARVSDWVVSLHEGSWNTQCRSECIYTSPLTLRVGMADDNNHCSLSDAATTTGRAPLPYNAIDSVNHYPPTTVIEQCGKANTADVTTPDFR